MGGGVPSTKAVPGETQGRAEPPANDPSRAAADVSASALRRDPRRCATVPPHPPHTRALRSTLQYKKRIALETCSPRFLCSLGKLKVSGTNYTPTATTDLDITSSHCRLSTLNLFQPPLAPPPV